jgi:hypothetical protein
LKSTARPFGNILKCMNLACSSNNTWRRLNERLGDSI